MIRVRGCLGEEWTLGESYLSYSRVPSQVVISTVRGIFYDASEPMEHSLVVANMVRENFIISAGCR